MSTQAERVLSLMKARGLTDRQIKPELARVCGITYQSVRGWFTGDTKTIEASHLGKIAKHWRCRLEWLVDGSGAMEPGPSYSLQGMADWDDSTPLDSDDIEIPLFKEVELAAGDGHAHQIEINGRKLRFSKATLKAAGVDIANAACATVSGNSMERLISDGATIGIDRGRTMIRDGEIYAIDHDGMLRVKYLYRVPGGLRLRSENSEEHPDEIYTGEASARIRVLGWVFWWSTLRTWGGR